MVSKIPEDYLSNKTLEKRSKYVCKQHAGPNTVMGKTLDKCEQEAEIKF